MIFQSFISIGDHTTLYLCCGKFFGEIRNKIPNAHWFIKRGWLIPDHRGVWKSRKVLLRINWKHVSFVYMYPPLPSLTWHMNLSTCLLKSQNLLPWSIFTQKNPKTRIPKKTRQPFRPTGNGSPSSMVHGGESSRAHWLRVSFSGVDLQESDLKNDLFVVWICIKHDKTRIFIIYVYM